MHYFSDSTGSQYKMNEMEFFATSHEKSPYNGIGM